jgi:flagellar biosynthesis GTPase FlhF
MSTNDENEFRHTPAEVGDSQKANADSDTADAERPLPRTGGFFPGQIAGMEEAPESKRSFLKPILLVILLAGIWYAWSTYNDHLAQQEQKALVEKAEKSRKAQEVKERLEAQKREAAEAERKAQEQAEAERKAAAEAAARLAQQAKPVVQRPSRPFYTVTPD